MAKDSQQPPKEPDNERLQSESPSNRADNSESNQSVQNQGNATLSEEEAESGSPEDVGTAGEEDPGAGLEFLIMDDDEDGQ